MRYIRAISILIAVAVFVFVAKTIFAQESESQLYVSQSQLYVPLIGITSVPDPLVLPEEGGVVTYKYAVKNFLEEVGLTGIHVVDNACSPVLFKEGDDDGDATLDSDETWRYTCTVMRSVTTSSTATATGTANNITATHKVYATVVVGADSPPPLVSIVNITKVSYPLSLPVDGGKVSFTYRVNNPGVVPLDRVSVTDDKCSAISSRLGDRNGNSLLDVGEVWVYTCTATLTETTTNTVRVSAFANGLEAVGEATITVQVAQAPSFPATGLNPNFKTIVWQVLLGILVALIIFFVVTTKGTIGGNIREKLRSLSTRKRVVFGVLITGALGVGFYFLIWPNINRDAPVSTTVDNLFGWKFPAPMFPTTGEGDIAYSDIRDPGGIPQGLPVRLAIPAIGVDTAIEDALITPDGRMDVPQGSVNVAWFALGPQPGLQGSAVIGGHFGIRNGVPFVFYDLDKLKVGDRVFIVDDRNDTLTFVVRDIRLFERDADATPVFISDDGLAHLNLITCEGIWNKVNDTYPLRRVVFTDLIPTEPAGAPAPAPAPGATIAPAAPLPQTLSVGSRGADVIALQTALIDRGFLKLPVGVAKGYYGTLTRDAVVKYQTSVGLPATGVFDPATRSKFQSVAVVDPKLPTAGEPTPTPTPTPIPPPTPTPAPPVSVAFAKSFFATPKDGLVTSLLLVAIGFMSYKILRRFRGPTASFS